VIHFAHANLRVTLGGGGSDLPGFYEKYGGFWITAAIDKYITVLVKPRFESELRVSYSELEFASNPDEIKHPVVREALKRFKIHSHTEIISISDLPSGTGLGSSGAFTVALLAALNKYVGGKDVDLPESAYELERSTLNRMTGRQDHYAAYNGHTRAYTLSKSGKISSQLIKSGDKLNNHLSLFYTGRTRRSNNILEEVSKADEIMLKIKDIGLDSYRALIDLDYTRFGELLHEHWELKRSISKNMSGGYIDKFYSCALKHGALGGKLCGAGGGGGFLMFCSRTPLDRDKLVSNMSGYLRHVPFKIVKEGMEVKTL